MMNAKDYSTGQAVQVLTAPTSAAQSAGYWKNAFIVQPSTSDAHVWILLNGEVHAVPPDFVRPTPTEGA